MYTTMLSAGGDKPAPTSRTRSEIDKKEERVHNWSETLGRTRGYEKLATGLVVYLIRTHGYWSTEVADSQAFDEGEGSLDCRAAAAWVRIPNSHRLWGRLWIAGMWPRGFGTYLSHGKTQMLRI